MSSNFKFLLEYAKHYPLTILATIIVGFSGAIFNGVSTTLIVPVVLTFLGQDIQLKTEVPLIKFLLSPFETVPDQYRLAVMAGAIVLAIVLKNLMTYTGNFTGNFISRNLIADLKEDGLRLLLDVDIDYHTKSQLGDLMSRLSNEVARTSSAISTLIQFFTVSSTLLVYVIILISISWELTLASILLIGLVTISNQFFIRYSKRLGEQLSESSRAYSIAMIETLSSIRFVKSVANEDWEYNRIKKLIRDREQLALRNNLNQSAIAPLNEVTSVIAILAIVAIGRIFFGDRIESLSTIILTYLFILFRSLPLLTSLNGVRTRFANAYQGVVLVRDFLNRKDKPIMSNGTIAYTRMKKGIHLQNIFFAYPNHNNLILRNIDIFVPQGTTLALVGGSGAGKSTLADLIPRFYDPTEGQVTIDGCDLREFDLKSLRRAMGIVSQETFLFNTSAYNNIAYVKLDATKEQVIEAAKRANAYEFIVKLPEGFDTKIGDRGVMLSGGQRQRISIARALLRNPEILILDEATSALDTVSERLVQEAIEDLSRDRTTIVIAHRLSTVQKADQIAVLEKGKVVELGTHNELLSKGGQYARLYSMQFVDEAERDRGIVYSSYELRSRLNPLIGFFHLLADDLLDDPDERSELINEFYHSASHILESLEFIEDSVKLRIDRR